MAAKNIDQRRQAIQSWLQKIQVGRDMIQSGRGNEENIKVKIVVPFLQMLGWDLLLDMLFEERGLDIVLRDGRCGAPALLVECKNWGVNLSAAKVRKQCLEYAYTFRFPHILLCSGQRFQILSAWSQPDDLTKANPIHAFSWDTLTTGSEQEWATIQHFLSREGLTGTSNAVRDDARRHLAEQGHLDHIAQFEQAASHFRRKQVKNQITLDEFSEQAQHHSVPVREALDHCVQFFQTLEQKSGRQLMMRRRSREIGLTIVDTSGPRIRRPCLVGLYAQRALLTLDTTEWGRLGLSSSAQQALDKFPKHLKDWQGAAAFTDLLKSSLKELDWAA